MNERIKKIDSIGDAMVVMFHKLALFGIGAATVWAAGWTFVELFAKHHASVTDLLLMFIYVEIGAMVGIYFKTNHMPVRFLLYIAITALTRHTVDIMSHLPININEMMAVAGCTFVTAASVLIVRYTSAKYSSDQRDEEV
jgi:phosphate starvation-inducible membrane PsiE